MLKEKRTEKNLSKIDFQGAPASRFLLGTIPTVNDFRKFAAYLYQGLVYSICNLKGPSEEYLRKKSVKLPERKGKYYLNTDSTRKFLMLDLDETLIHSIFGS